MNSLEKESIRVTPVPDCYLCGRPGKFLYTNLPDRLFGVPGNWHLKRCLNPECGLVWMDPRPTEEDIGKVYANYYTHRDIVPPNAQERKYKSFWEGYRYLQDTYMRLRYGCPAAPSYPQNIIRLLPLVNATRKRISADQNSPGCPQLLELGCGSGELLLLLKSLGWRVQGVDIDPVAVEKASAKGLEVHGGSLADQKFPEKNFDVIIMNHVIEHVYDPISLLTECHRVLRSRGRLIMLTPNTASWGHRIFKDSWIGLDPPRHLYVNRCQTLKLMTTLADFKVESEFTSANNAKWFFLASQALSVNKPNIMNPVSSIMKRIAASGFAVFERALVSMNLELGEEVVLVAVKMPADN